MNLYYLDTQLLLPPNPYIHPPLSTAFAGVIVAEVLESPHGVLGSAKALANHLEIIFFPANFGKDISLYLGSGGPSSGPDLCCMRHKVRVAQVEVALLKAQALSWCSRTFLSSQENKPCF